MILNDKSAEGRLSSPSNLMNRLKRDNGNVSQANHPGNHPVANRVYGSSGSTGSSRAMGLFGLGSKPLATPVTAKEAEDKVENNKPENIEFPQVSFNEKGNSFSSPFDSIPKSNVEFNSTSGVLSSLDELEKGLDRSEVVEEAEAEVEDISKLLDNADAKIKLGLAHDSALGLLASAVNRMQTEINTVHVSKLPSVISAAAKVVEGIRKERNEALKAKADGVHFHFYTPTQKKIEQYQVIEVEAKAS